MTIPETSGIDPAAAKRWLGRAGLVWLLVAIGGQMIFALYVMASHGREWLTGQGVRGRPVEGYLAGDVLGNSLYALHMLFTVVIIVGGALQLWPALRRYRPAFHRWMGRTYMVAAAILSLGGIGLILWRGTVGSTLMHVGTSLNGVVILICAGIAWMLARQRRFDAHRRWALRLFLAVSGVWFFRIMFMMWMLIFQAPVGFDPKTFTGPLPETLSFAQYLLPLAVLQLYFHAMDRGGPVMRLGTAGLLTVLALLTAGGIFGATMGMWLPRL
ncbi:MAG: DUF2306 domain-containing protein [Niveispirillum sp.]|uniref:DUF2306 domain-containing protein n=1 Tax=Niveispirillum sp. TaxID=1917217 RepID=UPI003BA6DC05